MYLKGYGVLAAFVIFSVAFACAAIITSWILRPKASHDEKNTPYECGMKLFSDARVCFDIKYYLYALLFLIFDIETIFLFPWAVSYHKLGIFALIEAIIFLAILFLGFIYAWKKDLLKWQ